MLNSPQAKVALAALLVLGVAASTFLLSGCSGSPSSGGETSSRAESNSFLSRVALEVPTIWCSTCKPRVEASARSVPGVKDMLFDTERIQIVTVTYDPAITTPVAIIRAIEGRGDKVTQVTKP